MKAEQSKKEVDLCPGRYNALELSRNPGATTATDAAHQGLKMNSIQLRNSTFDKIYTARLKTSARIGTIVVDAEEDFDWIHPQFGTSHSVRSMLNISQFQDIVGSYGAIPAYLLTYPVLEHEGVVRRLGALYETGECDLGIQLHSWVNPPFSAAVEEQAPDVSYSFAGNLPPALERLKLIELSRKFEDCFHFRPRMYRAGRYGLGKSTPALLQELGVLVDTSLAPRTNFSSQGGPDYSEFPFKPFWFGTSHPVLELPLCREIVGWTGSVAPAVYDFVCKDHLVRFRAPSLASWLRCAERITLSPEGNDIGAMKRLAGALSRTTDAVFVLSLHSSSFSIGTNPYVSSKSDLHKLFERLSGILSYLDSELGVTFVKLSEIRDHFLPWTK